MLIHELILNSANRYANRPALLLANKALSYGELWDQIRSAGNGLNRLGVCRNERIGIYLNKRFEGVVSYFAASYAGAVFVPINPALKPRQVGHILRDCDVSVLITSQASYSNLESELAECGDLKFVVTIGGDAKAAEGQYSRLSWDDLLAADSVPAQLPRCIDHDIASILYTSGSTGKPKGVVLSHRNMVSGAVSVSSYIGNVPDDRILAVLPFSFDAGFSQLTTAFRVGASVIMLDYLLPKDVLKTALSQEATGITGVPPLWNQLVTLEWPEQLSETLRYIANTGGAMPTETLRKLRAQLPATKVFLMYGLTESFRSTYLPPEEADERPTSIGKAIPNAEILVVREDGSICEPGEPGELVHRGALVSLGYWNDPERTRERFKPLPGQHPELTMPEMTVWSGDTVVADEDGYLYFVGRKDEMIKSSGYRISPSEVEEIVYQTGKVSECAALGIPHPMLGQAVVVVASGPNPGDESSAEILTECREALPNFMVPHAIHWQQQLPKNPNGKIDRKLLSDQLKDLLENET